MSQCLKPAAAVHSGMPALAPAGSRVTSFFEFWPSQIIYLPVVLQWFYLSLRYRSLTLPLISNPGIALAGMVGESKTAVLALAGSRAGAYLAPHISLFNDHGQAITARLKAALEKLQQAGIDYPLVAKPDLGCRGAGVKIIVDELALREYIEVFPDQATLLLQQKIAYEAEAGIFYIRHPDRSRGEIFSITLKYAPYVIGDGRRSLRQLIEDDSRARLIAELYFSRHRLRLHEVIEQGQAYRLAFAGSHCRGSIFRNGNAYISEQLTQVFDEICSDIDGFYYGRFDVRFENIEKLMQGQAFHILEINGASSEATHIWDRDTSMREVYRTLFYQYRTLFQIGSLNRKAGYRPASVWQLYRAWRREKKLVEQYPQTD